MLGFFKKPLVIIVLIIVVTVVAVTVLLTRTTPPIVEVAKAQRGDVIDEVSITGRVQSAEDVNLAFEKTGTVGKINVRIGDRVARGAMLVSLTNSDIAAQLLEAEAQLDFEQAKLDELQKGTRSEEIQVAQIDLVNAERKAEADLQDIYSSSLLVAQGAASEAKIALLDVTDIQYAYLTGTNQDNIRFANTKSLAMEALLGIENGGWWSSESISVLDGGAYGQVEVAVQDPTYENIDSALSQMAVALQKIKQALEKVPITNDFSAAQKTILSSAKSSINTEIAAVANTQQNILIQKVTNENVIATAKVALILKEAGVVPEKITAQQAKVKLAQASVQSIQAQLSKTVLSAPFAGVVTKQTARIGEIVGANEAVVSLLSEAAFEIEVNIPEADIARITTGNKANVTLDAYGRNVKFEAVVQQVDLAGTLIEGVAVYKTILQFVKADERIKSGMTANVDIVADTATDVIFVPQRAVISRDDRRIVRIIVDGKIKEVAVEIGLRGSEGTIEIISGIQEGDEVVVFIEE